MRLTDASDDLTARARIRDAAISVFGEHGFSAGVRAIAAEAGLSPGLVNHHFGSKAGLRAACDAHVLRTVLEVKRESVRSPSPAGLLATLAQVESYAPVLAYVFRSLQSGGELSRSLFEQMVEGVEEYLQEGIDAGTLRPSRDLKARARYLAMISGGGILLFLQQRANPTVTIDDVRKALREYTDQMLLPAVELFTEGLYTDSMVLDTLVEDAQKRGRAPSKTTMEEGS